MKRRAMIRRLYQCTSLLAAAIAAWDIATRGSLIVAAIMVGSAIALGLATFVPGVGTRGPVRREASLETVEATRMEQLTSLVTSRSLLYRLLLAAVAVTAVLRFGVAPDKPIIVDVLLASLVAGVTGVMAMIFAKPPG